MASKERKNEKVHPLHKNNPVDNNPERLPSVDIVVPAYNNQEVLNITLSGLEQLNYPSKLITLYILDDGSSSPIKMNNKLPYKNKILRKESDESGWGKANITNIFSKSFKSEFIWFLDSDMLVESNHLLNLVGALLSNPGSVALGYKSFVKDYESDEKIVSRLLKEKPFAELYPDAYAHDYWERLVEDSNFLQDINHDIFKSLVGASFLMRREDYERSGGYLNLPSAEDTVLGYQSYVKGLSFIPVESAKSYHLGSSTMQNHQEVMLNHNMAILADKVPTLYHYRTAPYAQYEREHTLVVYRYRGESFDAFTRNLRSINSVSSSFRIIMPIDLDLLKVKYRALNDEYRDLRRIYNYYKSTPSISFVDERNFDYKIESVLNIFKESFAVLAAYMDGDLEQSVDFKRLYKFFRPSNKVAVGGLDGKDSKLMVTTPALLNRFSVLNPDNVNLYFSLLNDNYFEWMVFDKFVMKVNERKDYWKFVKYIFRRLKTIRNLNDVKTFIIKAKIIIRNKLANR